MTDPKNLAKRLREIGSIVHYVLVRGRPDNIERRLIIEIPADLRDEIAAFLERTSEGGWRPIESAPRDGTEVLLFWPRKHSEKPIIISGQNTTGNQWWSRRVGSLTPTHWQPLPPPPEKKG